MFFNCNQDCTRSILYYSVSPWWKGSPVASIVCMASALPFPEEEIRNIREEEGNELWHLFFLWFGFTCSSLFKPMLMSSLESISLWIIESVPHQHLNQNMQKCSFPKSSLWRIFQEAVFCYVLKLLNTREKQV